MMIAKRTGLVAEITGAQPNTRRQRIMVIAVVAVLIIAAVLLTLHFWPHKTKLLFSGSVEVQDIHVGSKAGGRVTDVLALEGDSVHAGQVLVAFDDKELAATLATSKANYEKAAAGFRPEEIAQMRAAAAEAHADYQLKLNGNRPEDIAQAQADVDRAQADAVRADADWERISGLVEKDVVSKQQGDATRDADLSAQAALRDAQQKLTEMQRGFRPEEIAAAAAADREAQAKLEEYQRGSRKEDIDAALAQMQYDEAAYRERQVTSPAEAVVEVMSVRPGDLLAPNSPVATLLEKGQTYIRIYVPETEIARVHLGQKAHVTMDATGSQSFSGDVEEINQESEFLPRNVQTRDERVHEMFGVKVRVEDPDGDLRSGMAADVLLENSQ
jgi:multidrug resistance efflux pump